MFSYFINTVAGQLWVSITQGNHIRNLFIFQKLEFSVPRIILQDYLSETNSCSAMSTISFRWHFACRTNQKHSFSNSQNLEHNRLRAITKSGSASLQIWAEAAKSPFWATLMNYNTTSKVWSKSIFPTLTWLGAQSGICAFTCLWLRWDHLNSTYSKRELLGFHLNVTTLRL